MFTCRNQPCGAQWEVSDVVIKNEGQGLLFRCPMCGARNKVIRHDAADGTDHLRAGQFDPAEEHPINHEARYLLQQPAALARDAGEPAATRLPHDDADPGREPAGRAGRSRSDRAGEDGQRQDGRVCAGAAREARSAPLLRAGAGAVPDARTRRSGHAGNPPPRARRRQHQDADAVRRHRRCVRRSRAWSTARISWSARRAASWITSNAAR